MTSFCSFKIYLIKVVKRSLNPVFLEQFHFYIYDSEQMLLDVTVYDSNFNKGADDFMGRILYNLKNLEIEKTHDVKMDLEGIETILTFQINLLKNIFVKIFKMVLVFCRCSLLLPV